VVDFNKLRAMGAQTVVIDPIEMFERRPKPPGIGGLYASQADVLKAWHGRRNERDTVIKLQTGGGKTLVGLLIGQSLMVERQGPVAYVCPTLQLVDQTMAKATDYSIPVVRYETQQRGTFPDAFLNGQSILVCGYQALFNGLSRFGLRGGSKEIVRPVGMILDDAHVAFSAVRDAYTLRVTREKDPDGYAELTTMFRKDFEEIGRVGTFDDIIDERCDGPLVASDIAILEVPYWAWKERLEQVRTVLRRASKDASYKFAWPFVRDVLETCHCLVGHDAVSITPLLPAVDMIPAFAECPRRVFMSATIADDSAIIRSFDADRTSVATPISSASLAGVSERMILAPELTAMPARDVRQILDRFVTGIATRAQTGIVILTPSAVEARRWANVATFADTPTKVADAVTGLQTDAAHGPVVFANRYDGIDLPGAACRVLIVWDLPRGVSEYDLYRSTVFADSTAINSELAGRIEQGMGRGARGGGDYCVVIVAGGNLTARLSRKSNQRLLTSSTRAQVEMGLGISKAIVDEHGFRDTVAQCLDRDREWTQYHAEMLASLAPADPVDTEQLSLASAERGAYHSMREGHYEKAIALLTTFAATPHIDRRVKGWLQQLAARAAFLRGDAVRARDLQQQAHANNPELLRQKADQPYEPLATPKKQAVMIVGRMTDYTVPRGYLVAFDDTVAHLVATASANQFEQALAELGAVIGFEVDRPDHRIRQGPDVLWLTDDGIGFVIEAKSRKKPTNPLTKEEHGQLLNSAAWFAQYYPTYAPIRLVVHPNDTVTASVPVDGSYVLTLTRLHDLAANARTLLADLCSISAPTDEVVARCDQLLDTLPVRPHMIVDHYLAPFTRDEPAV